MNQHDRLFTLQEACDFLRCSRTTLYRLLAEQKLRGFKVGGKWVFRRHDLLFALQAAEAPQSVVRSLGRREGRAAQGTGEEAPAPGPETSLSGQWHLVKTRKNKERLVAAELAGWGIEIYLPLLLLRGRSGDRDQPYLRCYLFARFGAQTDTVLRVRSAPGVDSLVTVDGRPVPVPEAVVQELRSLVDARNRGQAGPQLTGALRTWMAQWGQLVEILHEAESVVTP